MYVATTRAKRHLHISYSDSRSNYGQQEACKRSQFITEIPTRLVHVDNASDEIHQPPRKKSHALPHMTMSAPSGFVTGKTLLNVGQYNKKR